MTCPGGPGRTASAYRGTRFGCRAPVAPARPPVLDKLDYIVQGEGSHLVRIGTVIVKSVLCA